MDIKTRPSELGYELRCCSPIGFDLTLCTLLGIGVKKLFDQGESGCLVSGNSKGEISPLHLKDLQDKEGKIKPRLVEIDSQFAHLFFQNLHYIKESDYKNLKDYNIIPEAYNFNKILIA